MKPPLLEKVSEFVLKRKSEFLFRELAPCGFDFRIDMSSNSYLALQSCRDVKKTAAELTGNCYCGNLASRLIAQTSPLYDQLELELADWKKSESALVFNSGYAANIGILQAFCSRHTDIFCDKLNHASIIDGCRLSGGRLVRYRHNDMADLERHLSGSKSAEKMIVTDTVFSMDGDRAPLEEICGLGEKYGCVVMVDEAHGTGIFGSTGSGIVEQTDVGEKVHIRVGTLSKAVSGLGGFFTGSREIKDYLVNSARSLIYSTGLPHPVIAYDLAAVRHIRKNSHLGNSLLELAGLFRSELGRAGFDCMNSSTQIVPVRMNSSQEAIALSDHLKSKGIFAPAIRPPTVPQGTERIRFSVHLGLDIDNLREVVSIMKEWKKRDG
ncbi:MAG: aminotransferase class I/II-fold pyridoxal phosphate-dependent enzyme [Chitinispirillaceae bacterium]